MGNVFIQNIKPRKIENALHNLKFVMKNPLLEDVILNDNWTQEDQEEDDYLWISLVNTYDDNS